MQITIRSAFLSSMSSFIATFLFVLINLRPISAQSLSLHTRSSSGQSLSAVSTASVSVPAASGPQTFVYDYGSILETTVLGAYPTNTSSYSSSFTTSSGSLIGITGVPRSSASSNATISSSSPQATNTRPCNGYIEFCDRKLSNVSLVVAHNSPFVVPHNAASNQVYKVITQLDDGIRGLQFETHYPNATAGLHLCHTSCDLLDVGTLESYLGTVQQWLSTHPYEVIAIMMGNDNRVPPITYVEPFKNAGLLPYLYIPPNSTLTLDGWPTLSEMILLNKRVVVMLDYLANQTEVPWLLDQFAYQWQTPFSPTDPAFPCTEQRPSNQADDVSRNMMYMVNHNLNIEIQLAGAEILIPAYTLLDEVNAVSGNGSLGRNVDNCTAMWGRPPNWLLVDYYNFGDFNGSVFQVAANANNVSYNRGSCCGSAKTSSAQHRTVNKKVAYYALAGICTFLFLVTWCFGLLCPASKCCRGCFMDFKLAMAPYFWVLINLLIMPLLAWGVRAQKKMADRQKALVETKQTGRNLVVPAYSQA